jgi:biopolymer transport protein ExbB
MPGMLRYLQNGDAITHGVAYLLLVMSIASWCVLLARGWSLSRAIGQASRNLRNFWQAPGLAEAVEHLSGTDSQRVFLPLAEAALLLTRAEMPGVLLAGVDRDDRIIRALRIALQGVQRRLERGQLLLASVASTAPFIGLLGTVWGIYHALGVIASSGQAGLENVAGPVGETLVMTAFGLVVAIPAVLAYNFLARLVRQLGEEADGFARDLHAFLNPARDRSA